MTSVNSISDNLWSFDGDAKIFWSFLNISHNFPEITSLSKQSKQAPSPVLYWYVMLLCVMLTFSRFDDSYRLGCS